MWAAQGKRIGVTADSLNVSDSAVKFHLKNVFGKLNVANKTRALAVAISIALIT